MKRCGDEVAFAYLTRRNVVTHKRASWDMVCEDRTEEQMHAQLISNRKMEIAPTKRTHTTRMAITRENYEWSSFVPNDTKLTLSAICCSVLYFPFWIERRCLHIISTSFSHFKRLANWRIAVHFAASMFRLFSKFKRRECATRNVYAVHTHDHFDTQWRVMGVLVLDSERWAASRLLIYNVAFHFILHFFVMCSGQCAVRIARCTHKAHKSKW